MSKTQQEINSEKQPLRIMDCGSRTIISDVLTGKTVEIQNKDLHILKDYLNWWFELKK